MPAWLGPAITAGGSILGGLAGAQGGDEQPRDIIGEGTRNVYGRGLIDFLRQDPKGFFPGQTYADQSPFTQAGIQGLGNQNTSGQELLQRTIQGEFLGMSPELQQAVLNPATQATNAAFSQLGRFGSQANSDVTQAAGINALLPYFQQERGRQQQAATLLPALQAQQAGNQLQAGGMQEAFNQQGINEQMARYNFDPGLNQLNQAGGAFGNFTGSPSYQQIQQPGGSIASGLLGGALAGANIANGFGLFGGGGQTGTGFNSGVNFLGQQFGGGGLLGGQSPALNFQF